MKAGLIGFPGSGRDTIFRALTGLPTAPGLNDFRQGEALVEDSRLDYLSGLFQPKKHTPARIELFLSRPQGQNPPESLKLSLEKVRDCDLLLLVLRNFPQIGMETPAPEKEAKNLESELLVTDYVTVEKRLEKLAEEKKRGKKNDPAEVELLTLAKDLLEKGTPLRTEPKIVQAPFLKGFGFLSAKPILFLINNPDDGDDCFKIDLNISQLSLRGSLEAEISRLEPEEAGEFLADYGLSEPGRARVVKTIYGLMDLISFFTVGEDECRAWTINRGEDALSAAGRIHSDIKKGFIRAEVVAFADFQESGGFNEAKKKGLFRLEGKTYIVADGDIVHFRFNV
jgi:ribosome-binding ATPase YchF (GTP1/OBG family)